MRLTTETQGGTARTCQPVVGRVCRFERVPVTAARVREREAFQADRADLDALAPSRRHTDRRRRDRPALGGAALPFGGGESSLAQRAWSDRPSPAAAS